MGRPIQLVGQSHEEVPSKQRDGKAINELYIFVSGIYPGKGVRPWGEGNVGIVLSDHAGELVEFGVFQAQRFRQDADLVSIQPQHLQAEDR